MKKKLCLFTLVLTAFAAPAFSQSIADGLTNLWYFNETSGPTATAAYGSANWTISNGSWSAGMFDNAATGTGNFYGVSSATNNALPELAGAETFTFAVWLYMNTAQNDFWSNIISRNENATGMLTGIETSTSAPAGYADWDFRVCGVSLTTNNKTETSVKLVDNQWNHVAFTWDKSLGASGAAALNVFINGAKVPKGGNYSVTNTYGTFESPGAAWKWNIGMDRLTSSRRFGGKMDEMAIWTRILSDKEVASLYAAGAGNSLKPLAVTVTEGSSDTFTLKLPVQPAAFPATVLIEPDDPNAINPSHANYQFDIDDPNFPVDAITWGDDHIITLTPNDDSVREEPMTYLLSTLTTDADAYTSPLLVELTIQDDDTPQIVMEWTGTGQLVENGGTDTLTVSLTKPIIGSETVTIDLSVDSAFLTLDGAATAQAAFTVASQGPVAIAVAAVDNTDTDNATVPYESYSKTITVATTTTVDKMAVAPNVTVTILEDDCGARGVEPLDASGPLGQPDCVIDIYDLQALASDWLNCDFPNSPVGVCL